MKAWKVLELNCPEEIEAPLVDPIEVIAYFFQHGSLAPSMHMEEQSFEQIVKKLFEDPPLDAGEKLRSLSANKVSRERMIKHFTSENIFSMVELTLPVQAEAIAEMIGYWFPLFERSGSPIKKELIWHHVLEYIGTNPSGSFDLYKFLRAQLIYVSRKSRKPIQAITTWLKEQVDSADVALPSGIIRAFTQLNREVDTNASRLRALGPERGMEDGQPEEGEELYIKTAGVVILYPVLSFFFEKLGLLNENKEWVDEDAHRRSVLLLHYVVTKHTSAPEFILPLYKLLCGFPLEEAIEFEFEPTQDEKDLTEEMLKAVITRWPSLTNTSPDGLRGTFLIREGRLAFTNNLWVLKVETKTLDFLMDTMGWSLSVIKLPWMDGILKVEWR